MKTINFLSQQGESPLDKFITWMLSYGRMIVMVTEFIALLAFLYRFGLDQQLVDLHDKIKQESAILSQSAQQENTYLNLQQRLQAAKKYDQQAQTTIKQFTEAINQTHGTVTFSSLNYTNGAFQATVTTTSTAGLNAFVQNIRNLDFVTSVDVGSIQNKISTGQVVASINAVIAVQDPVTTTGAQ